MMTEVGDDALGLLRVRDAAVLMGLGQRTVWRMVASGELESITRGPRCRRILRQSVADWIQQRREADGHIGGSTGTGSAA